MQTIQNFKAFKMDINKHYKICMERERAIINQDNHEE